MNSPLQMTEIVRPLPYRFAATEFLAMADVGILADRYVELVDGEIVELSPPGPKHSLYQGRVITALATVVAVMSDVWLGGDTAILIDEDTVVGCDAVIARGGADETALQADQIVLAVEISVSTIGYDLGSKVRLYARAGIAALWVVDPEAAVVHCFDNPLDGSYRQRSVIRFGEPLPVPGSDRTIVIN
jgi:Uma2 family endonuclease